MRILISFLALLLFAPNAAFATDNSARQEREASRVFWEFSSCVVERMPTTVRRLLTKQNWGEEDFRAASALAQRSARDAPPKGDPCGSFDELRFQAELFRGALAGAMFVKDYRGRQLPDFSILPNTTLVAELANTSDASKRNQLGLAIFAHCVFRNKAEEVRSLLLSRPFSPDELNLFQSLSSTLGTCMPAAEGAKIGFSRAKLRALLGEAAYNGDAALSNLADSRRSR